MLIFLTATPDSLSQFDPDQIEELFSELLRASSQGLHMVVLTRAQCDWARETLDLNTREKAQLQHLKTLYTQRGNLPKRAPCFMEVTLGEQQLEEVTPNKYRIGHIPLLRGSFLTEAKFILENVENDGDMLDIILKETGKSQDIKYFHFLRAHGGGADTPTCFRAAIPEQRVIVTLVDSDKKAPMDGNSQTYRNLIREANRQMFVGMIDATPCKEIENLVPFSILRDHRQRICSGYENFENLQTLLDRQSISYPTDCLWLFFDVKKGIEAEKLAAVANPDVRSWLDIKFLEDEQSFYDLQISGFGDGILRQFLNCGAAVKEFVQFIKGEYWAEHFGMFFANIYWYFVAEKPRATV